MSEGVKATTTRALHRMNRASSVKICSVAASTHHFGGIIEHKVHELVKAAQHASDVLLAFSLIDSLLSMYFFKSGPEADGMSRRQLVRARQNVVVAASAHARTNNDTSSLFFPHLGPFFHTGPCSFFTPRQIKRGRKRGLICCKDSYARRRFRRRTRVAS